MERFNKLVSEQLKTMDRLLFLEEELERCRAIEEELIELENKAKLSSIRDEIRQVKTQLKEIQLIFEKQTEEVIQAYRLSEQNMYEPS